MSSLKDSIYNFLVRKNENVKQEYERYVMEHTAEHYENRLKHWKILWKLNWHYRVRKKTDSVLYFEDISSEKVLEEYEEKLPVEYKGEKIVCQISGRDDTRVSLTWNLAEGIKTYIVQKYDDKQKIYRQDGSTDRNHFNVRKLKQDTKYRFRIVGISYEEEKVYSNEIEAVTLCSINKNEANPYMDGAESELYGRRTVHFLAKELLNYDVISFDIFDTLIVRPFSKPRDLFMMLDERFDMLGFASIRQRAEMTVREINEKNNGNREVTLSQIYEEIERRTGLEKEMGMQTEFELEYELCRPNPYMLRLFNLLKYAGKRIILISDMYLETDMMKKILEKCGYTGYEELFISCEYNGNKYSGTLYKSVMNKLGKDLKYMHIGDNYNADIVKAKEMGMDAFYYKSCNELGNKHRAAQYGMSPLIGTAYSGLINTALHNGLNKYSVFYEYGYVYGGIYVYGLCTWIHKYAIEYKLDKILFFARDGYIYKKVYDDLFKDIPSEYVFSSRIANSVLCAEKQRDNFLIRNIEVKANYEMKTTVGNFLDTFQLEFLDTALSKYKLHRCDDITPLNAKVLVQMVIDHWDEIVMFMEKYNKVYEKYVKEMISDCKNIAIVDTGWQGTTLLGMKWLIEEKWDMNCTVHCLMAASQTTNEIVNQTQLMKGDIKVYMFSSNYNRNHYLFHKNAYGNNLTSYLFELFTQAPHPTFCKLSEEMGEQKFEFGIPEVENYQMINEIHKGIYDFCCQYYETFKNYPFMSNISGHDAYIPFRFIAKNPRMFKQYFLNFAYSKATGGDMDNQSMEDMRTLFENERKR